MVKLARYIDSLIETGNERLTVHISVLAVLLSGVLATVGIVSAQRNEPFSFRQKIAGGDDYGSFEFSGDGKFLFVSLAANDRDTEFWFDGFAKISIASGTKINTLNLNAKGRRYKNSCSIGTFDATSDGSLIAVACWGDGVFIFDTTTDKEVKRFKQSKEEFASAIDVSPNDKLVAGIARPNKIFIWDIASGKSPIVLQETERFTDVKFSSDSAILAAANEDNNIYLYSLSTNKQIIATSHCR